MAYVLILGGNSDIAKAVSRKYAQNGYSIYLAGKNPEELEGEARTLESKYAIKAKAVKFDALEFYNHKNFYNNLGPKPTGVICVVGYTGDQYEAEDNFLEAKKILDINLTGCISILNVVASDFEDRKEGFIVGITSVSGDRGRRGSYLYGAAKAGFTTYLSGLRSRLIDSDVHVMTVKPGIVVTKSTENDDFPVLMTAKADEVANDIFRAQQKNRDVIYTKWLWKYVSWSINCIPEFFYKRMHT